MNDFDYENMQKKRIARGALHKKGGSKSKKCPMSTDNLTRKEWEKLNSNPVVYKLGEPMTWKQFKGMPKDLQEEYLQKLIDKFDASMSMLAQMFCVHAASIARYIRTKHLNVRYTRRRGCMVSEEKKIAWKQFIGEDVEPSDKMCTRVNSEVTRKPMNEPKIKTTIDISVTGEINIEKVVSMMQSLLGDTSRGTLLISFEKEEDI